VDTTQIAGLLEPFLPQPEFPKAGIESISTYIDILIRWNARINLTAIRDPKEIVTRHFGESLFAATRLFPVGESPEERINHQRLLDIGSGAGFPGIPIKIWAPQIHVTLVESNQKKATFLREVIRALTLTNIDVFAARAETLPPRQAEVVTLRAVERFPQVLPVAATLVAPPGRLALLIGSHQAKDATNLLPEQNWQPPLNIPGSSNRILLIGFSIERNHSPSRAPEDKNHTG